MKDCSTKIIDEVSKQLYGNKISVRELAQMLSISMETAYRRVKNQIPFSVNEVAIIAEQLNLSIDQMLDLNTSNHFPFYKDFNSKQETEDVYSNLLKGDIETMDKLLNSNNVKITATMNRIPFRLLPYQMLFKFDYCHYLYSTGRVSLATTWFSGIEIPPAVNDLYKKACSRFQWLDNIICVIDNGLYTNLIRKIQYYQQLQLISDDDIQLLQRELFELLKNYENLLRTGKNGAGFSYVFYSSFFPIDSNVVFVEFDANSFLQVWVYPESPLIIWNNPLVSDAQKQWIDSKIRNSALITKTADRHQVEMLRDLYRQVEELR